ncbi:MAG: flagellar hook-associated protein FlgL [Deltaproteobacteria bacterium]|nr:flagellar hook-associated protein FlgL [Deltaproteobacteria bacterium]
MNRITQQALYSQINFRLRVIAQEMSRLNESISSGKKFNRPSDDVLGGATILAMRTVIEDIKQYERDLSVASSWLMYSESALQSINNSVAEAKTLAVQMATGTYRDSNMDAAAIAIDGVIDEIIQATNTNMEGRYIFAGSKTDTIPFTKGLNINDPVSSLSAGSAYTGRATSSGSYTGNQTRPYLINITTAGGAASPYAEYTTNFNSANDDLTFTALTQGAAGDAITLEYIHPGAGDNALSVSVAGNAISVSLETVGGIVTATAADIMAAINDTLSLSSALVTASLAGGNNGSGIVSDMGGVPQNLSRAGSGFSYATATTDMLAPHTDLKYEARVPGSAGNSISISYVDPGAASQPLTIGVVGNAITVNLATDATGAISSTAGDIMAAIKDDTAASSLVNVFLAEGNSGLDALTQTGTWNLSDGFDNAATFQVSEDGGLTWGPADEFTASTVATNIYDSTGVDLDLGVQIAFTNEGALSAGDTFSVDVSHYQGNTEEVEVSIQRQYRVRTNVHGEEVIGTVGDPDNALDCLFRLKEAMETHDSIAVGDELPVLDRIMQNMTRQMAETGVRINRTETSKNILENSLVAATQRLSDHEDVDIIEAFTNLELQQRSYEAALMSTSVITSLSLLDYIR